MNTQKQEIYTISQPWVYIFITKHLGKLFFCAFLLMIIVAIIYQEDFAYIKRLFHIVIVLSVIGLIIDRFLRKIAYKIIIDFNQNTIEFYMCRSGEANKYNFNFIKTIAIKKYAIFVLDNRKILYNLGQNELFNRTIDRLRAQAGVISEKG